MAWRCAAPKCRNELTGRQTKWCSGACRRQVTRVAEKSGAHVVDMPGTSGRAAKSGIAIAVRKALSDAGRLDTPLGQLALSHAELLTTSRAVMGRAPLSKELRDAFTEAMRNANSDPTALDEINESARAALSLIRGVAGA